MHNQLHPVHTLFALTQAHAIRRGVFLRLRYAAFLLFILSLSACMYDKDPVNVPVDPHSQELITSVVLVLSDTANAASVTQAKFSDPDGPGGSPPAQNDTLILSAGHSYTAKLWFLDESRARPDTLNAEILSLKNEHLVVLHADTSLVRCSYLDFDDYLLPLGLEWSWRNTQQGAGTVRVVLKHQPGVKDGTESPGETDVDVTLPLRIQ